MKFMDQHKLALSMGANYYAGYWNFPSPEARMSFQRQVAGLEWTPEQKAVADAALVEHRKRLAVETA